MSEKPSPAAMYFLYKCTAAHQMMLSNSEPEWFREHFEQGQHIEEEYGIPAEPALVFALALELTLSSMPSAAALKALCRKVEKLRSRLEKCRADVSALHKSILVPVGPEILDIREMPDGSMEVKRGPDPTDELILAINSYLEKLDLFDVGRRTSPILYAVRKVDELAREHNPKLTLGKREKLCEELFDIVRERDGHRSRSPDHYLGEMPRYRDLLQRVAGRSQPRKINRKGR